MGRPIPCTLHSGVIRCLCSGYDGLVRVHESRYYELLLPSLSISGHPSFVPRIACIWVCNVATMGIPASGQYPIPRVGCSAEAGVMVVVVVCGRWLHIVEELSGGREQISRPERVCMGAVRVDVGVDFVFLGVGLTCGCIRSVWQISQATASIAARSCRQRTTARRDRRQRMGEPTNPCP